MADSADEDRRIAVSPRHTVLIAREYLQLLESPPKTDFVVRTIARRQVGDLVLMTGELVIAGEEARRLHPLASAYPLHFKKTYFPGQMHGDPEREFECQELASRILSAPPPIGYTASQVRSCLVPGQPYSRLSPFGVEPEEMNISLAEKVPLATAAGLFVLAERAFASLLTLHDGGISHGDAELQNCIVCPSPLEPFWIDFEGAVLKSAVSREAWEARCDADLAPLLREAAFLQCALGRQTGRLADRSWPHLDRTFRDPERFRQAIGQLAEL